MHWFGAVVVPIGTTRDEVEKYVGEAMAPYNEETNDDGWWDWWQVGGRWTGVWGEYDATKDERNMETCFLCRGTGERTDATAVANGWTGRCNGCGSTGTALKHPTQWVLYDADVIKVAALLNNPLRRPITVVTPDGKAHLKEWWDGETWQDLGDEEWEQRLAAELEPYRDQALVVVDYHS